MSNSRAQHPSAPQDRPPAGTGAPDRGRSGDPSAFARHLVALAEKIDECQATEGAVRLVIEALVKDFGLCEHAFVTVRAGRNSAAVSAYSDAAAESFTDAAKFLGGAPRLSLSLPDTTDPAATHYTDDGWKRFVGLLGEKGVRAMYVTPLGLAQRKIGTLAMFAHDPGAFDGAEHVVFSDYVSIALHHRIEVENLTRALETRSLIGTAIGILMERRGLSEEQAWELLTKSSQERNVRLVDICRTILAGPRGE